MMTTIANAAATRKPQAYFAQLDGVSGIITKPGDAVLFFDPATETVTPITPANTAQLLVLRNVEEWMTDYYADLRANVIARRRPSPPERSLCTIP